MSTKRPNLEELSLRNVLALPNASNTSLLPKIILLMFSVSKPLTDTLAK